MNDTSQQLQPLAAAPLPESAAAPFRSLWLVLGAFVDWASCTVSQVTTFAYDVISTGYAPTTTTASIITADGVSSAWRTLGLVAYGNVSQPPHATATGVGGYDYDASPAFTVDQAFDEDCKGPSLTLTTKYETGLWYFRARYFDSELGRFISRDPIGYTDGMNRYAGHFASFMALDPSGEATISPFDPGTDLGAYVKKLTGLLNQLRKGPDVRHTPSSVAINGVPGIGVRSSLSLKWSKKFIDHGLWGSAYGNLDPKGSTSRIKCVALTTKDSTDSRNRKHLQINIDMSLILSLLVPSHSGWGERKKFRHPSGAIWPITTNNQQMHVTFGHELDHAFVYHKDLYDAYVQLLAYEGEYKDRFCCEKVRKKVQSLKDKLWKDAWNFAKAQDSYNPLMSGGYHKFPFKPKVDLEPIDKACEKCR